jgi:hypothetical protein
MKMFIEATEMNQGGLEYNAVNGNQSSNGAFKKPLEAGILGRPEQIGARRHLGASASLKSSGNA